MAGNALHKAEMENHRNFWYTIGMIQQIAHMGKIDISQTVAPTLPGFEGINRCVKYMTCHPHKPIFYPSTYYNR